jgi:hypothetical protein
VSSTAFPMSINTKSEEVIWLVRKKDIHIEASLSGERNDRI